MRKKEKPDRARKAELFGPALIAAAVAAAVWMGTLDTRLCASAKPQQLVCKRNLRGSCEIFIREGRPWEAAQDCDPGLAYLAGQKMDINRASGDDLARLPWVGPVTAGLVLQERQNSGGFISEDQYLEISGITQRARQSLDQWTEIR